MSFPQLESKKLKPPYTLLVEYILQYKKAREAAMRHRFPVLRNPNSSTGTLFGRKLIRAALVAIKVLEIENIKSGFPSWHWIKDL